MFSFCFLHGNVEVGMLSEDRLEFLNLAIFVQTALFSFCIVRVKNTFA